MNRKNLLSVPFIFSVLISNAQLNGSYTIGGVSPDFPTFFSAVTALASSGVSGAVLFNIRNGIYNEKISIPAISGTTPSNTITFQSESGDSSAVVLVDSASTTSVNNYTLQLSDADFIIIKKITVQRTGPGTYASVIAIGNNSSNNKFLNNHILGINASTSTTNNSLVYSLPGGASVDSNNVFSGNFFENGSYGMYYCGQSAAVPEPGTSVTNNIFRNQYARYISMLYQSNLAITGNDCATNSLFATMYGISLTTTLNGFVTGNKVSLSTNSGYGFYFSSVSGTFASPFNIANNMIHIGGNGTACGLYLSGCAYVSLDYNSVNLTGTGVTSRSFYVTGSAIGIDVINNVFVNAGGGHAFDVAGAATSGIHLSDFNDLYTSGSTLGYWSSAVTDLAALQSASGMDGNSVSADPGFYASGDLHVNGSAINNLGTPLTSFTSDFDGDLRSTITPDIGADEFVPLTDNIGVVALVSPATNDCGDSSTVIGITIKNFGLNSQAGVPLKAEISGAVSQTLTGIYSRTLASNSTDTFYFVQTINTVAGGAIDVTAYSELASDQYKSNDTIHAVRNFNAVPGSPLVQSPQLICDSVVSITATPDSGSVLFWYDQPNGNLLFVGNPFTPLISTDTTFYVTQHKGSGAAGCMRITECGLSTTNFLEIENVSGAAIDATGWVAVISNSYTDVNLRNPLQWNLDFFNAGEINYKSDAANDNYWGNNMLWNPGNNGWAMIVDNAGNVIDFVAMGWTDAEIQSLFVIVNGFPITVGAEWTGDASFSCAVSNSVSRIGTSDHNDAADFDCEAETKGMQNSNLSSSFSDCGIGSCGSYPVAVDINLEPGITVTLPNDTVLVEPFSFIIDAGAGYSSYLWSTGETTQSITVTTGGTFWVTVTGINGCEATDTIVVNSIVDRNDLLPGDEFELFPNPAAGFTKVSGLNAADGECKIIIQDLGGREMYKVIIDGSNKERILDISSLAEGVYLLSLRTDQRVVGKILHIIY